MSVESENRSPPPAPGLSIWEQLLIYPVLALWVVVFLVGTLVASAPFRATFGAFGGPVGELLVAGLVVLITYTYTNVGILCLLSGLLGTLGRRAQLGATALPLSERDSVNPRSTAILRGFLVYLAMLAGVLVFGDDPVEPTQNQYIRLAGLISLLSFVVNARPSNQPWGMRR